MWRAFAVLVVLLQTAPQPRASLEGHVVRLGTTDPIVGAMVVLARVGGQLQDYRTSLTEQSGAFAFRDLEPGSYRLYADRDGYLPTEYGQRTSAPSLNPLNPSGVPISLAVAQDLHDIFVTLTPPGVITGRVEDNNREPMSHVWVRALKATYRDGERTFSVVAYAETDDTGDYRLFGLAPGLYFVNAIPRERPRFEGDKYLLPAIPSNANNNQSVVRIDSKTILAAGAVDPAALVNQGYLTVYYPGATDPAQAASIEIHPGRTTDGIDMTITSVPTVSVRGKVIDGLTGQPIQSGIINLLPLGQSGSSVTPSTPVSMGSFELSAVPSGAYFLSAQTGPPGNKSFAKLAINVSDRDLENITVAMKPGAALSGRIDTEGGGGTSNGTAPRPSVILSPGYPLPPPGLQGRFFLSSVPDGDYTVRIVSPSNAFIKRAQFGATDALQGIHIEGDLRGQQLDIVISYNTATLDVLALDDKQNPAAGVHIVAVPDPARRNRSDLYRSGATDASGRVRLQGIPPGDYKIFASADMDVADWQDPDVIRTYESRGEPIQITEGAHQTSVVKLATRRN